MLLVIKTLGCLVQFLFIFLFLFIYFYSLECLYLGGNFIREIPPELANLPSLSYLVLCDNKIQSVPPQLSQWVILGILKVNNTWELQFWGLLWLELLIFNIILNAPVNVSKYLFSLFSLIKNRVIWHRFPQVLWNFTDFIFDMKYFYPDEIMWRLLISVAF